MIKWQVSFEEKINEHHEVMERLLPLKLMQLKNADLNNISNVEFHSGDLAKLLDKSFVDQYGSHKFYKQ